MARILIFFCLFFSCFYCAYSQQKRPNILFILSDDHAYQAMSIYGNKLVQTPNIDRIGHNGAVLENSFVANSICGPSRAALLTGKYSHKNGYEYNDGVLDTTQSVISSILSGNGYQTAWIGKWHLGSLPFGFDDWQVMPVQGHYFNPDFITPKGDTIVYKGYVTNIITQLTENYLNNRDTSKPFFLVVGEKATHREWLPDIPDLGRYDKIDFPLPTTFYDQYESRSAASQQLMEVGRDLTLKTDLKIHQPFGTPNATSNSHTANTKSTFEDATMRYYSQGEYARMDSTQSRAYHQYYDSIAADIDRKQLKGDALVRWKYQRYLKDYYATAYSMDQNIGKILNYLDSTGLSDNTIVIYTSDQGFYLGEHGWFDKRFIYDQSLKTGFVVQYPKAIRPNTKIDQFVSNVDWAPTLLDMAGVSKPSEMQGSSFLPLLRKQKVSNWQDAVYYHYYEYPQPHHVSPHFGIRTKDYMLVRFYKGVEKWELYDLKKDPNELHNVYEDPGYKKVAAKMQQKLKDLIIKNDDQEALHIFEKQIP
ncbi:MULTISPECIES: sulfatase family protein [Chitinophagaceae]